MEKAYYTVRAQLMQFKLDYCCWFAPVRVGLLITGYFNVIADVVCLLGIANDGFSPTITKVQEILIKDFVNKPIPVLAYACELGFSVVLLCAIHRRDLVLMSVFMYYTILAVIMSFLIYSIVIIAVPLQIQLAIIFSTLFQIYVAFLVRSVMVEIKMEKKQYELPRLVMSSLVQEKATPGSLYIKNGEAQEVKVTEVPKRQDVTVVGKGRDEITQAEVTDKDVKKDTEVKDKDLKKDAVKDKEIKTVAEVELKKDVEVKDKDLKKVSEVKLELEPKKSKDKDEKKKIKDEKKNKDEKKSKDEKKNKDVEKEAKGSSKDAKKDLKETWLQTVNEHPKE